MDTERDLIHRLLDGDADPEERKRIAAAIEADPALLQEFGEVLNAVRMLEHAGRIEAPPSFTAEVMRKIAACRPSLRERIRDFLFAGRVLRWNIASAAAAVAVTVVVTVVAVRFHDRRSDTALMAQQHQRPITVRIEFAAPQAQRVAVAGDFNRWSAERAVMSRNDKGVWSTELILEPGVYAYMFVVDGSRWEPDPRAESFRDDGFGDKNSVLRVGI